MGTLYDQVPPASHFLAIQILYPSIPDASGKVMTSHGKSIHLSDRALLTRKQLKTQIPDPEMRVMSVATVQQMDNSRVHTVCAGCSDGSIR